MLTITEADKERFLAKYANAVSSAAIGAITTPNRAPAETAADDRHFAATRA